MKYTPFLLGLSALVISTSAAAEFVLQLPLGAKETYSQSETGMASLVAVAPFANGALKTETAPGNIRRSVWAFGGEQTLAEVQKNILDQLENSDYEVLLFCQTKECGGFDFRFAIDVVAEPQMRIDLRDFRFVSAKQAVSAESAYVTFLLSKSPSSVYVQMTEYTPDTFTHFEIQTTTALAVLPTQTVQPENFALSIVLEGLQFDVGSANLGGDPNNSLPQLAELMRRDGELKVFLVGHSDMSGTLEGNIALSSKRAKTIQKILIEKYSISKNRLSAHGVGFLSPRAPNNTEAGKAKNRRVEAVFSR